MESIIETVEKLDQRKVTKIVHDEDLQSMKNDITSIKN